MSPKVRRGKVLVADDLTEMRTMLEITLMREGWTVLLAENGKEAVEMTAAESPDIVLMDYNMPALNGIEACQKIKENETTRHIQVVIYTGAYASGLREDASSAGAYEFLTKPLLPPDLYRALNRAMDARP